jgi:hypothetical protein
VRERERHGAPRYHRSRQYTLAAALAATILTIAIGRQERECPWKPSITGTRGEHENAIPCFENGVIGDVEYLVR